MADRSSMSSQDGIPSSLSTVADRLLQKLAEAHRISLLAAAGPFNGRVADRLGLTKLAELDAAYADHN
ncbi:hypothetical protein [Mesorhizobium sp.]|uniref:hypothetical protein n=1 Tax=Mesorhizobium sp. TaxID=1871066 RepID=UPI0025E54FA5|nr:hypothetical protein [Mesorhizobium sp.]